MAPIKDAVLGGVGNVVGAVEPPASIFVVMKHFLYLLLLSWIMPPFSK